MLCIRKGLKLFILILMQKYVYIGKVRYKHKSASEHSSTLRIVEQSDRCLEENFLRTYACSFQAIYSWHTAFKAFWINFISECLPAAACYSFYRSTQLFSTKVNESGEKFIYGIFKMGILNELLECIKITKKNIPMDSAVSHEKCSFNIFVNSWWCWKFIRINKISILVSFYLRIFIGKTKQSQKNYKTEKSTNISYCKDFNWRTKLYISHVGICWEFPWRFVCLL